MTAALNEPGSSFYGQPVTVYSTPSCVQCKMTYLNLDRAGIPYDVVDVTVDPEALAYVTGLGYTAAPVVVTGETHWSGFRPDRIAALTAVTA